MAKFDLMMKAVTSDPVLLDKAIASIKTRSKSMQRDVACAAASCVLVISKTKDARSATALVAALGGGWRTNALKTWFLSYGPLTWAPAEGEGDARLAARFKYDQGKALVINSRIEDEYKEFVHEMVTEKPFWVLKPEPEFKGLDMWADARRFIARVEKAVKDHPNDPTVKVSGLPELKAAVLALAGEFEGPEGTDEGNDGNGGSTTVAKSFEEVELHDMTTQH